MQIFSFLWLLLNICFLGMSEACLFFCKFLVVFVPSRKSFRFLPAPHGRRTFLSVKFTLSSRKHNASTCAVNCDRFLSTYYSANIAVRTGVRIAELVLTSRYLQRYVLDQTDKKSLGLCTCKFSRFCGYF